MEQYKIAVASTDGKVINQHFGRAEQFIIIEPDKESGFKVVEVREVKAVCNSGTHDDDALNRNIELLSDCRYVLVSMIGMVAENALLRRGITAYVVPDIIEDAVNKLIAYVEKNSKKVLTI